jgi:hypothetical protein
MTDMTTNTRTAPGQIGRLVRLARVALAAFLLVASGAAHAAAQGPAIGTVGLTPGWATFGQVVPPGVAMDGLQVGSLPTQTDVKNRWPDGSIRFAVVTVHVPSATNYVLRPGTAAAGTFAPLLPAASVAFVIGGDTYVASLPTMPSPEVWLSGPHVHEARSVVPPVSEASGAPHPFLRVNFDTRVYHDGQTRVDVSVENVLDVAGATTVSYDVTIAVDGESVFAKTAVEHYYLTRWRKTLALGANPFASATPDLLPYNKSGALPPYLPLIANIVYEPVGPLYEILQSGALDKNMPAHGGRPELAPYPNWTARYLVHRDPKQRAFVLANGDLSGSWPIHVREAEGSPAALGAERLVSLDQRPRVWYDERAQSSGWDYIQGMPLPIREYGTTTPGPGQTALIPDNAHQPSLAYVPYLMTGDRYYVEEMAFWANYAMLRTFPGDGLRGSTGLLQNNELRGFGWALRNLVDAAAYYPDASPVKAYLSEKVRNNLRWIDEYTNALDPVANPFRVVWTGRRPEGPQYISLWEQSYLAHAIDRANQQGFSGGLGNRDVMARLQLRLFTSEPDYPRPHAAPYVLGVGTPGPSGLAYHTTIAEIWAASVGQERPFANFYGPEARINLIRAVENAWPGAREAYDYLWPFIGSAPVFCPDGGPDMPDLACRAGWAIDFSMNVAPAPVPAQIISPAPGSTLASSSEIFKWNAGVGVTGYELRVGTSIGADDLYAGAQVTALSAAVTGLPANGSEVWVRLSSLIEGVWQHSDYTFTAADSAPDTPPFGISNVVVADGFGAQVTPGFDTAAGDLLVAFVSSSGPAEGGQTMTVAGGGLAWTLAVRENGQLGVSEIWTAPTPTVRSGLAVTSTPAFGTPAQSLVVMTIRGAAGAGATARASAPAGGPSVSLTTTGSGSLVLAVGNDWNGSVARVLGPNQSIVHEFFYPENDTFWVQRLDATVPVAGTTVTLDDIAPTDHIWNFAAIEIVPASDPPPVVTWATPGDIVYGTPLGGAQLNASANVPGTFTYTPPVGTVLDAGVSHTLRTTFTPQDTAREPVTASVTIGVVRATPLIDWTAPSTIEYGTALGPSQLNATADVPGTFEYVPPAGTLLPAGVAQALSVAFTPADAANYTAAAARVSITVLPPQAPPALPIDEIVLHAAAAPVVAGEWQVVADETAASGARLQNRNAGEAKRTTALAAPLDYFELTFLANAGKPYRLWIRGKALGDAYMNDSVFVQFDGSATAAGAPNFRIGTTEATYVSIEDCTGCGLQGWGWQDNAYGAGALGPVIYFAATGPQRMRIQVREDGIGIDQIVLSAGAYLTERPGATKNDTTLLRPTASGSAPTVSLIRPAEDAAFLAPATIGLTADAFDSDGSIARVEFYAGATLLDTRSSPPYAFSWSNVPAGAYLITAHAVDNTGQSATSAAVSITVAPSAAIDEIVLHAAAAPVALGAWELVPDSTAASGARLQNRNAGAAKRTTALAAPVDYFELTFFADAGKPYRLWIRGKALGDAYMNDSVFVQFDRSATAAGAPAFRIGTTEATYVSIEDCTGCGLQGWGWQDNAYGAEALGPVVYFAATGPQRVRLQVREDGIGIDQIVLSAGAYLTRRPGTTKDDATILPKR